MANQSKMIEEEMIKLIFEYATENGEAPSKNCVYKGQTIGLKFSYFKVKIQSPDDELYKIFENNIRLKKSIDACLETRKNNLTKVKLTTDEKIKLMFEYVIEKNEAPLGPAKYKEQNIGYKFNYFKRKITSTDDELYKIFENNTYLKKAIDDCLETRKHNLKMEEEMRKMRKEHRKI
jgi:antitoxin component of RelBE/YafQ-DinJ toxin-antitoxin module